jgi:hypothetical protein
MCPDHPRCRNPDKKILFPRTVSYDHIRLSHLHDQMIVSFETRVLSAFHMRIGQLFTELKSAPSMMKQVPRDGIYLLLNLLPNN